MKKILQKCGIILLIISLVVGTNGAFFTKGIVAKAKETQTGIVTASNVDKKLVLKKGQTFGLKLQLDGKKKGKKKFYYQSSNVSVATVSEKGVITAKKKGTATIQIHLKSDWNVSKNIKVTVGKPVTRIKLKTSLDPQFVLPVGIWMSIKTKVYPTKATYGKLKWTSSNAEVAKVTQKGNIKGLSQGTTIITAITKDSTRISFSYELKVGERVAGIAFKDVKQWQGIATGTKYKIPYEVTPATASNQQLNWTSSNPSVLTVDSAGEVTAVAAGTAVIIASAVDGSGVSYTNNFYVEDNLVQSTDCSFVAHRGFSSEAPENTLAAFRKAGENNFWGAECDVQMTVDGELVISHDSNMLRMFGVNREISTMTLAEIKKYKCIAGSNVASYPNETMPTFKEYLAVCKQYDLHPVVEIKDSEMSYDDVNQIIGEIKQYFTLDYAVVISFHTEPLSYAREIAPTMPIHYLSKKYLASKINTCLENGYSFDCEYTGITIDQINSVRAKGVKVHLWTLDDKLQAFTFIQNAHVDFITTNYKLFK